MLKNLLVWILSVFMATICTNRPWQKPIVMVPPAEPTACAAGYRAVAAWDMGFLAVGTDGTVDLIASDGEVTSLSVPLRNHLHAVTVANDMAWIVGDAGAVLSFDGEAFHRSSADITVNLYATAHFADKWFIGGSGGILYRGSGDGRWQRVILAVKGDIVGLAASEGRMIGVTASGETFATTDGVAFTVRHYNAEMDDTVSFHDVTFGSADLFWATGEREDGSPVVLASKSGGVWSERALNYMDGAAYDPSDLRVFGAAASGGQMLVACSGGGVLTLPDCLQCNTMQTVADALLTDVAYNGGKVAAVGEGFAVAVTDDEAVRQYKVSAETAHRLQSEGAVIVDVRDAAEYSARHIAGSISVPLAELETRLPQLVPDRETTVIFYCSRGVRSQTAVERAIAMEYYRSFTLGAMDNWTYAWEPA